MTAGDLDQLCETSLMSREEAAAVLTPASMESVESGSRTVTEKSVREPLEWMNNNNTGSCETSRCSGGEREVGSRGRRGGGFPPENSRSLVKGCSCIQMLRFVTSREGETIVRSLDDVFMAEEESESFKQQVKVTKNVSIYIDDRLESSSNHDPGLS